MKEVGKARQGKARQGKARQGKARQGNTTLKEQSDCSLKLIYVRLYLNLVSPGTQLTAQFPSHGLGEAMAYGFQTLSKVDAL